MLAALERFMIHRLVRRVGEDPSALSALSAAVFKADNADKADNGLRVGLCVNPRHQTDSDLLGVG